MNKKQRLELDKLIDEIVEDRFTTNWNDLNYMRIPTTMISAQEGNEVRFNKLYKALKNSDFKPITRTKSGGISIKLSERFKFDKYDVRQLNGCIELTIATLEKSCRIQFRLPNFKDEDTGEEKLITGREYFTKWWLPTCKKFGIDMKSYAHSKEEGLEYKKQIHMPDIKIYDPAASYNCPYANAYHIDFHKFYMSGLMSSHPEFKPVVEELAAKAKTDPMHKTGLASIIGYMQSKYCGYRYAILSRDAINDAYSRFDSVKADAKSKGFRILATNTDGIWLVGEYHGPFEGPNLTEWSIDHANCYIRFKSAGSYEFVENGKYFPVVRGRTRLDREKPRSEWTWGDIFKSDATAIKWQFDEEDGIVWKE